MRKDTIYIIMLESVKTPDRVIIIVNKFEEHLLNYRYFMELIT